jgi:hypothetical protein
MAGDLLYKERPYTDLMHVLPRKKMPRPLRRGAFSANQRVYSSLKNCAIFLNFS